ncbi:phosphoribosyltransferase [bacterium]|nr:phosphoribosyltransferase [bacterium]
MFIDRRHAGQELGRALHRYAGTNPIVLALPRGGVPIGREVASALDAELDVLIVRKLGAPNNPEFAIGAVGEGGAFVLDEQTVVSMHMDDATLERIVTEARREIDRRVDAYRRGRSLPSLAGRTVIIVDDGLATGSSAAAAVEVIKSLGAEHIVLAVPTGSHQAVTLLRDRCDEVVCLEEPPWFGSVGAQYESFPQVSDEEVLALLRGDA